MSDTAAHHVPTDDQCRNLVARAAAQGATASDRHTLMSAVKVLLRHRYGLKGPYRIGIEGTSPESSELVLAFNSNEQSSEAAEDLLYLKGANLFRATEAAWSAVDARWHSALATLSRTEFGSHRLDFIRLLNNTEEGVALARSALVLLDAGALSETVSTFIDNLDQRALELTSRVHATPHIRDYLAIASTPELYEQALREGALGIRHVRPHCAIVQALQHASPALRQALANHPYRYFAHVANLDVSEKECLACILALERMLQAHGRLPYARYLPELLFTESDLLPVAEAQLQLLYERKVTRAELDAISWRKWAMPKAPASAAREMTLCSVHGQRSKAPQAEEGLYRLERGAHGAVIVSANPKASQALRRRPYNIFTLCFGARALELYAATPQGQRTLCGPARTEALLRIMAHALKRYDSSLFKAALQTTTMTHASLPHEHVELLMNGGNNPALRSALDANPSPVPSEWIAEALRSQNPKAVEMIIRHGTERATDLVHDTARLFAYRMPLLEAYVAYQTMQGRLEDSSVPPAMKPTFARRSAL